MAWSVAPAPWPPSARPLLSLVIAALPAIDDDLVGDLLTRAALLLVQIQEDRDAGRAVLVVALAELHDAEREIRKLKARRNDLIGQLRALVGVERKAAL